MERSIATLDELDILEFAAASYALFEQYDDELPFEANDPEYENLYPNIAC